MKMKLAVFLMMAVAGIVTSCGRSDSVKAKQPTTTTRWKWEAKSAVATSKGLIVAQTGDDVSATFVYLKEGDGFEVDKPISIGKYYPAKRQIVLPPGPVMPDQVDQLVSMNVPRVEVAFTPDAPVMKGRWLGQGSPEFDMDFVRVQNK